MQSFLTSHEFNQIISVIKPFFVELSFDYRASKVLISLLEKSYEYQICNVSRAIKDLDINNMASSTTAYKILSIAQTSHFLADLTFLGQEICYD